MCISSASSIYTPIISCSTKKGGVQNIRQGEITDDKKRSGRLSSLIIHLITLGYIFIFLNKKNKNFLFYSERLINRLNKISSIFFLNFFFVYLFFEHVLNDFIVFKNLSTPAAHWWPIPFFFSFLLFGWDPDVYENYSHWPLKKKLQPTTTIPTQIDGQNKKEEPLWLPESSSCFSFVSSRRKGCTTTTRIKK